MFAKLRDYVSDNSIIGDAAEEERKLREISPDLLCPGEKVVFAFLGRGGKGRDSSYFTDHRLLIRDVTGMTGKKVKYRSTPYKYIKAWAVSTAGGGIDSDSELQIWASGMAAIEIEFSKDKVDLFALNQFLNFKCLPAEQQYTVEIPSSCAPGGRFQVTLGGTSVEVQCPQHLGPGMRMQVTVPSTNPGTYGTGVLTQDTQNNVNAFMNWMGSNAQQVDPRELEQRLRTAPPVLAPDERIEMAFRCGRDYTLLSSKRFIRVDPRGVTGKKVVYFSMLWKCVRSFRVTTAGTFLDMDAELHIYTNIASMRVIAQDLRKGQCDVMAVQRFFSDKLLGLDNKPCVATGAAMMQGQQDTGGSLLALIGDDNRQVDAVQADAQFHSNPPILQGLERVEMAFRGRRDMILFTTKRLVVIDVQGFISRKQSWTSVPWTTVLGFGVQSAGSFLDKDSEFFVWTDIMHDPPPPGEDNPPPQPGMSYLEFDFQKDKVDLMAIQRYLATRCLPRNGAPRVEVPASVLVPRPAQGLESLLNWIGNDATQLDAGTLDQQLKGAGIVLNDESTVMGFKAGRDSFILTDRRVLVIDVQGFTGKRVAYTSIPYASIRAFSVESAGSFDRDSEVKIYTRNHWTISRVAQDLRKGKADIIALQNYLSNQVFGVYDGASGLGGAQVAAGLPQDVGGVSGFLSWLGSDATQIDPQAVNKRLHEETPILLPDETVEVAFKCGRDMLVHTTKRIMIIDVQGLTGKKVEYYNVPLKFCTGFEVATAGMLDRDAEVTVFADVPAKGGISADLRNGKCDLFELQKALASKLML
mmetsp:Transcript_50624/g.123432  ORF Transcript_50624/g.123432 Transcript_50624/m.123432 type:complete len:808 (+) Transcript_50624:60-2483(+)